jgi:very-short-patch-repair endonuclease
MASCKINKEDFYNEIKCLYEKFGRINKVIFNENSTLDVNFDYYCLKYGGIRKICNDLNLLYLTYNQISRQDIIKDVLDVYKKFNKINKTLYEKEGKFASVVIRREFGGYNKLFKLLNLPINISRNDTRDEIVDDFMEFYAKYKTTSSTQYRKHGRYSQSVIERLFGSWQEFILELNLKPINVKIGEDIIKEELKNVFNKYNFISKELIDKECSFTYQALTYWIGGKKDISKFLGVENAFLNRDSYNQKIIDGFIIATFGDEDIIKEMTWDWFRNDITNSYLYADIYIPSLNLAIEYDGEQHFKFIPFFHKTIEKFHEQQQRDILKNKLLKENHINLIRIKYNEEISYENIINKINQLIVTNL